MWCLRHRTRRLLHPPQPQIPVAGNCVGKATPIISALLGRASGRRLLLTKAGFLNGRPRRQKVRPEKRGFAHFALIRAGIRAFTCSACRTNSTSRFPSPVFPALQHRTVFLHHILQLPVDGEALQECDNSGSGGSSFKSSRREGTADYAACSFYSSFSEPAVAPRAP
jgi:hypothetical protein